MLTIIGAAAFHGPVRDGKEWFHSAMGTRLKLVMKGRCASALHVEEVKDMGCDCCASHLGNLVQSTRL
jgi:hypothetical protein